MKILSSVTLAFRKFQRKMENLVLFEQPTAGRRVTALDVMKGLLILRMVFSHFYTGMGFKADWLTPTEWFFQVVVFSGLVFSFGFGSYKAYLVKETLPRRHIILNIIKILLSYAICGVTFEIFKLHRLSLQLILSIVTLETYIPMAAFLLSYALLLFLVLIIPGVLKVGYFIWEGFLSSDCSFIINNIYSHPCHGFPPARIIDWQWQPGEFSCPALFTPFLIWYLPGTKAQHLFPPINAGFPGIPGSSFYCPAKWVGDPLPSFFFLDIGFPGYRLSCLLILAPRSPGGDSSYAVGRCGQPYVVLVFTCHCNSICCLGQDRDIYFSLVLGAISHGGTFLLYRFRQPPDQEKCTS